MSVPAGSLSLVTALTVLLSQSTLAEQPEQTRFDPACIAVSDELRRRPGNPPPEREYCEPEGLRPAVWGTLPDFAAVPDRWRIISALGYSERWWDP